MSVQFGKCYFDGKQVDPEELDRVRSILQPYGPDAEGSLCQDGIAILYRAFHTTKESRGEVQPCRAQSGAVVTWNGRLDNRAEFLAQLGKKLSNESADSEIVAAAYDHWETACFSKLIGDWALSIWDPRCHVLLLAQDFVGTQHLYYSLQKDQATWSTILDPLILFANRTFRLSEEYIAGWLSQLPAAEVTPYRGIHAVPPSCFVCISKEGWRVARYWDFDSRKKIHYRTDDEYEEHFREVFAQAVGRRLRSDTPVLAELSGGMDSSAIVCTADSLFARGAAEAPQLDTVSYFNDSEPEWDERPYVVRVENKRGRIGCHIDVGSRPTFPFELVDEHFAATPGAGTLSNHSARQFNTCFAARGNRVLLSGLGGDEVAGGVPSPTSELQDLIASVRWRELACLLKAWALKKRKPWIHLLSGALGGFLPTSLTSVSEERRPAEWLDLGFVRSNRAALEGYRRRVRLLGPVPSFQENLSTLDFLRRQLGCSPPPLAPLCEWRYPFLDRDLLEFLFAIPRRQLIRPHQRRSLMRRALRNVVPEEILARRKAFVSRAPLEMISLEWPKVLAMSQHMRLAELGVLDAKRFLEELQKARTGREVSVVLLMRVFTIEAWLGHLLRRGILVTGERAAQAAGRSLPHNDLS